MWNCLDLFAFVQALRERRSLVEKLLIWSCFSFKVWKSGSTTYKLPAFWFFKVFGVVVYFCLSFWSFQKAFQFTYFDSIFELGLVNVCLVCVFSSYAVRKWNSVNNNKCPSSPICFPPTSSTRMFLLFPKLGCHLPRGIPFTFYRSLERFDRTLSLLWIPTHPDKIKFD